MRSAEANDGNLLAGCAEIAVEHFAFHGAGVSNARDAGGGLAGAGFTRTRLRSGGGQTCAAWICFDRIKAAAAAPAARNSLASFLDS